MRHNLGPWGLAACIVVSACAGTVTDNDDEYCDQILPGPSPVRRLTGFEYNNTVRDLLGDDTDPARDFPPEEISLGFNNQANNLVVSPVLAEQYMIAAEGVAERATADMATLLPCDPVADGEDACARRFVVELGKRAWRRPLVDDEVERIFGVYTWGKSEHDFQTGIQLAIQALLQSPHFLYRVEFGTALEDSDDVNAMTDWEMAARLSYLLWSTMPDEPLFAAAQAGELREPEQIQAHAERMLADPRARAAVRDFYTQWLQLEVIDSLEKDAEIFPSFYAELRPLLRAETERFLDYVIWEGAGTVDSLLTADFTFMNAELAAYYGIEGLAGEPFERVTLDPTRRAGFLTHAGHLAAIGKPNQTAPVQRGKFVREQLLCQQLPPPPDNIVIVPPDLDPSLTSRERWSAHALNPACSGCHELMDPIGFGFEHFDGAGSWRDDENGLTIDATGELIATDIDGPYDGAIELVNKLAASEEVYNCVATQYFRFGYGRAETGEDICTVAKLSSDFSDAGHNFRDLIVALTQTDAFRYRYAVVTE